MPHTKASREWFLYPSYSNYRKDATKFCLSSVLSRTVRIHCWFQEGYGGREGRVGSEGGKGDGRKTFREGTGVKFQLCANTLLPPVLYSERVAKQGVVQEGGFSPHVLSGE